jgi:thiamine biosynthesis lipoprotein
MRVVPHAAALVVTLGSVIAAAAPPSAAAPPTTIVGPAMGTVWRVTLGGPVAGATTADVHRAVEAVLDRIDRAASTWRTDSDVSRFNRAAAGEWVEIAPDLAAILGIARRVHERSAGAFDITVAPLVRLWRSGEPPAADAIAAARGRVGMRLLQLRAAEADRPAAIRKSIAGVELDLDGIAPGYAVDRIGERLVALGSGSHLVELGGEVRAWGTRSDGGSWRVAMRSADAAGADRGLVDLAAGMALATSTIRPGGGAIDPRSGQRVERRIRSATALAESCAEADAWAVAALVLDLDTDDRGFITAPPAPSTRAGRTGARRAAPSAPPGPASAETPAGESLLPRAASPSPWPRRRCSGRRSSFPSRRRCCWRCRSGADRARVARPSPAGGCRTSHCSTCRTR